MEISWNLSYSFLHKNGTKISRNQVKNQSRKLLSISGKAFQIRKVNPHATSIHQIRHVQHQNRQQSSSINIGHYHMTKGSNFHLIESQTTHNSRTFPRFSLLPTISLYFLQSSSLFFSFLLLQHWLYFYIDYSKTSGAITEDQLSHWEWTSIILLRSLCYLLCFTIIS